ncbi:alpha/beta fold hydrolase [Pseudonocardia sp. TRM90224]|uniref:alpha/beta fold hydrolase n=1 Tax=Pseudonocardia sp. TRM90224 TaxID=2812678 RepID=UPI001E5C7116|nr:alpha/beta hydrolase [Pseudonocardia sp. TRM90224]
MSSSTAGPGHQVHVVGLESVTVGFECDGASDGRPLMLLHGFPDAVATWDGVVGDLLRHDPGLRIVRPYIRGHGPTVVHEGLPITAETSALAQDVVQLADHLGINRFHLVGSDWGCRAAYALAGLWPDRVRSMVTVGTGYNEATPITDLSMPQVSSFWYQWLFNTPHGEELLRARTTEFCRHLWRVWSPSWSFSDAEFEAAATAFANPQFVDTVLHYYRYRWGGAPAAGRYVETQRHVESMPDITVPTTHIQGGADFCTRPETASQFEGRISAPYHRVDLPGIGHFPQREVPVEVAAVIRRAIARVDFADGDGSFE